MENHCEIELSALDHKKAGRQNPPTIGPWGRATLWSPVATARSPRAIASSAACCLFNATCATCHDDWLSHFEASLCPTFYLNQSTLISRNKLKPCAAMTLCRSCMRLHFGQSQSRNWQLRLCPCKGTAEKSSSMVLQENTFSQDITPWLRQRAHLGLRAPSPAWIKDEDISREVKKRSQPSSAGHFREENPKFPLLVSPLLDLEGDWEAAISILPKHLRRHGSISKDGSIWLDVAAAGTKPVLGYQSHGRVSPATNWLQGWIGLSENETNSTTSSATSLFHLLL